MRTRYYWKPIPGVMLNQSSILRGMVLWLPLNEGIGTKVNDVSASRNAVTVVGATWTNGKFGKCMNFDGTDDKLTIPSVMDLSAQSGITISAWFCPASPSEYAGITLGEGVDYNDDGIVLRTTGGGNDVFQALIVTPYNATYRYAVDTTKYDFGLWYHVVGTYTVSDVYLYVDGVEVAHNSGSDGTINFSNLTDDKVRIGVDESYNPDNFYKGKIDNVGVWDRVLSLSEIKTLKRIPYIMMRR